MATWKQMMFGAVIATLVVVGFGCEKKEEAPPPPPPTEPAPTTPAPTTP